MLLRLIVKNPVGPNGFSAETLTGLPLTLRAKDSFAVPESVSKRFVVAEKVILSNRQGPLPLKVNWMASSAPRLSICGSVSETGMNPRNVPLHVTPIPRVLFRVIAVLVIVVNGGGLLTIGTAVRVVPP